MYYTTEITKLSRQELLQLIEELQVKEVDYEARIEELERELEKANLTLMNVIGKL